MAFEDFLTIVSDNEFIEKPVGPQEFVTSPDYMDLPGMSDKQYLILEKMTQIYKRDTLEYLYGKDEGERLSKRTVDECVLMIGKGGGKTMTNTVAVSYVVYKLLCLRDPQKYYGKPRGDSIDIINVALNAKQAENVFFNPMRDRIKGSKWFENSFETRAGELVFDKNIRCFSGHSEREGWEGYNLILAILDEIAGFAVDNTSGNKQAKTAESIYQMYKASVQSRFPRYGKIALLSFPRFKGDFITSRYDQVVHEKQTLHKTKTMMLDDDNPAMGEITVDWEEDEIISYKEPKKFAMRAPSWVTNPIMEVEDYRSSMLTDMLDFLSRFACMPPESIDAFFKDETPVYKAFPERMSPYEPGSWRLRPEFKPQPDTKYYIHVDLGYKHDRAAVAMAHVSKFVDSGYAGYPEPMPFIEVDAIRYWTPSTEESVDFTEIKEFILMMRARGFKIELVTFDQWQSVTMRNDLESLGVSTDKLSVNKNHYTELKVAMSESRVMGYRDDLLIDELLGLRIIKGDKVDHPRKGSNDIADAVCGAVYNAMANTQYEHSDMLEVMDVASIRSREIKEQSVEPSAPKKATEPPPAEIADWLSSLEVI